MRRDVLLVAVEAYPDGGGISTLLETYCAELTPKYEVHVAIVEARDGWSRIAKSGAEPHVIGYSNLINPLIFPTSVAHSVRVGLALRRLVDRYTPVALITQDALHLAVPGQIAVRRRPTELVLMDHGTLTNVYEPGWASMVSARLPRVRGLIFSAGFRADRGYRAFRWRSGVRRADFLWYTGSELRPYFERAGSRAQRYSQSVPRDVSPAGEGQREAARRALHLRPGTCVINSVGRLDGEKGLDTIIDAMDCSQLRERDYTLLVAGSGSLEGWMRQEVRTRGLDRQVRFLGRLDRAEVAQLHHASDLHIYAGTVSCGVSICLLEAMASGVAPIASDVPAAQKELVADAGWIFPAARVDALRRCLLEATAMTLENLVEKGGQALAAVHNQLEPSVPSRVDELVAVASRRRQTAESIVR